MEKTKLHAVIGQESPEPIDYWCPSQSCVFLFNMHQDLDHKIYQKFYVFQVITVFRELINCGISFLNFHHNIKRIFFFWESFNLWYLLLIIALYYQIKIPINFWCRWELNLIFLIQLLETLLVELSRTH